MSLQPPRHQFGDRMLHVARGHKLPLLHVHRPAGGRGGQQDVGLPAEKRRNLEQVADLPGGGGLVRQMHVGRHRQAGRLPDPIEHGRDMLQNALQDVHIDNRLVGLRALPAEDVQQAVPDRDLLKLG